MGTNLTKVQAVDLRSRLGQPADPSGVCITDALIEGPLDLAAFGLGFPLAFERCTFTDPVSLEGADLHSVTLIDCTLPGVLANGLRVRRDVDLTGSTIAGSHRTNASTSRTSAVWLCESVIGGRLICLRTTIDGLGGRALQGDRIQIAESARFMHGFTAIGEIRMPGARLWVKGADGGFWLRVDVPVVLPMGPVRLSGERWRRAAGNGGGNDEVPVLASRRQQRRACGAGHAGGG